MSKSFTRFTINGRAAASNDKTTSLILADKNRVGEFQPFDNSTAHINDNCKNTISEADETEKTGITIIWKAPDSGSGCVAISAMIYENPQTWFSDDDRLTIIVCESSEQNDENNDYTTIVNSMDLQ